MSSGFIAEFVRLRTAAAAEPPDWDEIRLVFQALEPHAKTPEMHDALDTVMTAPDWDSLKLAVNRLEVIFTDV